MDVPRSGSELNLMFEAGRGLGCFSKSTDLKIGPEYAYGIPNPTDPLPFVIGSVGPIAK